MLFVINNYFLYLVIIIYNNVHYSNLLKCLHLKQILTFKSYEEAKDLENFIEKIILISNNFTFYLKESKKLAINFKNTINDSALIKNLN